MENRKAKRNQIEVDIETAHPAAKRCYGYAEHVSRTGISILLREGALAPQQRSVILNFRIWTGREILYRKIYARVVRAGQDNIALEFARCDFTAESIIRELMFFQRNQGRAARLKRNSDGLIEHKLTA